jgi:chromosome segregation ATPase
VLKVRPQCCRVLKVLQSEYDQLLWDSREEHAVLEDLQEKWELQRVREESLQRRLEEAKSVAELEQYRVLEKERQRWEAREDRLVERLEEMQGRVRELEKRVSIPGL